MLHWQNLQNGMPREDSLSCVAVCKKLTFGLVEES